LRSYHKEASGLATRILSDSGWRTRKLLGWPLGYSVTVAGALYPEKGLAWAPTKVQSSREKRSQGGEKEMLFCL
jgi:hypothetical protein